MWFCLVVVLCCSAGGCDEEEGKVLGPDHPGWKSQHCGLCHELPVEEHSVSLEHACAECHGGNGACDPNASTGRTDHDRSENCMGCHQDGHEFDEPSACASCHFAFAGVVPCVSTPDEADAASDAAEPEPDGYDLPPDEEDVPPESDDIALENAA
ncbi:MAG: hypothetical protein ABIJ56_20755 [Pseudomonadota bacterium]